MSGCTDRRAWMNTAGAWALGAVAARAGVAAAEPKTRLIRIVAKKFEFVPAEIHVRQGETVTLQFTAPDVPMGFNLADFHLRADIVPGKVAELQLTADKPGRFGFFCDVFCGSGHEDMSGTLFVT
jgi:cytochrome c oxidase subunit 2